ncbi:MAG: hypothetical protein ACK5LC_06755 [Coprobacillaceae bacterium]
MIENKIELQKICKSLAVLDAIICEDWEYRYHSYNSKWDEDEECYTMRNGQGDELLILFKDNACIVNGYINEKESIDTTSIKKQIPKIFHSFIYKEPIKTIGTTFVIWTNDNGEWNPQDFLNPDSLIEEFLNIYTNTPEKYIEWAIEYYELDALAYSDVDYVYKQQPITKDLINNINKDLEDIEALLEELKEIDYPYSL